MKLFNVTIDNDPGGWKSGQDRHVLVLAHNSDEAIDLVQNGNWGEKYDYEDRCYIYGVGEEFSTPYISKGSRLSATEVKFDRRQINLNKLLV